MIKKIDLRIAGMALSGTLLVWVALTTMLPLLDSYPPEALIFISHAYWLWIIYGVINGCGIIIIALLYMIILMKGGE